MARTHTKLTDSGRRSARGELQARFLDDLLALYELHGRTWLERVAERDPALAVRLVSQLLPTAPPTDSGPARTQVERLARIGELARQLGLPAPGAETVVDDNEPGLAPWPLPAPPARSEPVTDGLDWCLGANEKAPPPARPTGARKQRRARRLKPDPFP